MLRSPRSYIIVIGHGYGRIAVAIDIGCIGVGIPVGAGFCDIVSAERADLLHGKPLVHALCVELVVARQDTQLVALLIFLHTNGTRGAVTFVILLLRVISSIQIGRQDLASGQVLDGAVVCSLRFRKETEYNQDAR